MFALCKQVIPYLEGTLSPAERESTKVSSNDIKDINSIKDIKDNTEQWLTGTEQDRNTIQQLYQSLQKMSPQAGNAYWMTRTWDLLCWQPMYIAFIAIYGLKKTPDFNYFKQRHQHDSVVGFVFQAHNMKGDEPEQLISSAAQQLKTLFEHYRLQLDTLHRCRPGYVKRLIADLVLGNLLKVKQHVPDFTEQDLQRHAEKWLTELGLPTNLISALVISDNKPTKHIRSSCCLTYKANNDICGNCPKQFKNKKSELKANVRLIQS